MEELFDRGRQPLAARMRPRTLAEYIGQEQILGSGKLLRRAIESDQLSSIILSGPPGTGKTTLARVIANTTRAQFLSVSAVLSGVKDIRAAIGEATTYRDRYNRRSILFVDEVHRWNKSQQDALLPWVEEGLIILIGATTENPWFEVNRALLSRSRVFILRSLSKSELGTILDHALADRERGYGALVITLDEDARGHLIKTAAGDARTLLNALELAVDGGGHSGDDKPIRIDLQTAEDSIQRGVVLYDKDGDYHFDTISAFIKSIRGSDPDAALYWLARMVHAGEDPRYIFRRMLISASEDVGLADPNAITVVTSCAAAFDRVGLPEGQFHLAQAALYLAGAEKSNSTLGYFDAVAALEEEKRAEVPMHLRDSSRDGDDLGHGKGYLYPHAYTDHWVAQAYLPAELANRLFYQPGELGWEGSRRALLAQRRRLSLLIENEDPAEVWATRGARSDGARWIHTLRTRIGEEVAAIGRSIVDRLRPVSTDRLLLIGDMIASLVPIAAETVPEGLTAAWTSPAAADRLTAGFTLFSSRTAEIDLPQITSAPFGEIPSPPLHPGPFDRILYRDGTMRDPEEILTALLPLLAPTGSILVVETEPLESTRPSALLQQDGTIARRIAEIEGTLYPPRGAHWHEALDRLALRDVTEFGHLVTRSSRELDGDLVRRWFAPEGIYATHDHEAAAHAARILEAQIGRSIEWKRVATTIMIRRVHEDH